MEASRYSRYLRRPVPTTNSRGRAGSGIALIALTTPSQRLGLTTGSALGTASDDCRHSVPVRSRAVTGGPVIEHSKTRPCPNVTPSGGHFPYEVRRLQRSIEQQQISGERSY